MSTQVTTHIDVTYTGRNKKTVFWRPILVLPMLIFACTFMPMGHWGWGATGIIVLPVVLSLLFRSVYPSYVLTFNHAILELQTRITSYLLLLNDDFPTIERNPRVAVMIPDVEGGKKLSPWLPLVKWILALPLIVIGLLYSLWGALLTIVAWVSTWSTGTLPAWAGSYNLRLLQFWNRVTGYCIILVTDEYPPFAL